MKTPVLLKRLQFGDSGSDKTEPRGLKCQHLNECDNKEENDLDDEEGNGLDEDKSEIEGGRYVSPPFVSLPPLSPKV